MERWIMNLLFAAVVLTGGGVLLFASAMTGKQRRRMVRILVTGAALLVLQNLPGSLFQGSGRWVRLGLYLGVYLWIGYDILGDALWGLRNGRLLDENFLMAVATLGALVLGIWQNGDYLEAIAVMLFYQLGEWFQSYAVGKSRRSIAQLMDVRPDTARVEREGQVLSVAPEEVSPGEVILVYPGEKIPLDGTVLEGFSSLDTGALTGESMPREAAPGDAVTSGCISLTGILKIRTSRAFEESTVSRILELVENASSRKSRSERFISRFARVYTPTVCAAALALATVPPLVCLALGEAASWPVWIYRALTFLVISCPCALVISIPLSFFAGIGGASRQGILIKGSNYLEQLAGVTQVVFDKTGTLTQGSFQVARVVPVKGTQEQLLTYAALAEYASSHPISRSLCRAWHGDPEAHQVESIRELPGEGITAQVDGSAVAVGNIRLMARLGLTVSEPEQTGTVVYTAVDGCYAGYILICDVLKPTARAAIEALKKRAVTKTVMLTGDNEPTARETARALGIGEYYSGLLPADKVERVEALLPGGTLAFVGDGINDAPVLSRADVGIAMGAMGSDAAIEAADVVLMDDDPGKLVKAMDIARSSMTVVRENIILALGVKLVCLLLGALGLGNMYLAIFADVGVMILAVLNAMRCLFAGSRNI